MRKSIAFAGALALAATMLFSPAFVAAQAERPRPTRPDPVRPDPVRPDPVRPDPVRPDPVRPDPVRPLPVPDRLEAVAERCIEKAQTKTYACGRAVAGAARRCVNVVRRLVDAGHIERARWFAARCGGKITATADRCADRLERHCTRCATYLRDNGAPELADRVRAACADLLERLADLVERALAAIAQALLGAVGTFDDRLEHDGRG